MTEAVVSGTGKVVHGTEAGVCALSAECFHLAPELDMLQKHGIVVGLTNTRRRQWGRGLGGAISTAGRGVQLSFSLAGKSGRYVGGYPAGPDAADEVVRNVRARHLRWRRNGNGLRSPVSSVRSWRMRCSYEEDNRFSNTALSVV